MLGALALVMALLSLAGGGGPSADEESGPADSCVACHSDPRFLVRNKKLYDYFQDWKASVHSQEGVTCSDCHGGNPEAFDKRTAHRGALGESSDASAVNFKNVPDTCGQCHEEILEGFRKSRHFEHVVAKGEEKQGPTCVTCHGSINVEILNVESVGRSCSRCHNEKSGNHPENPERATRILNRFLSIQRFYRYIMVRAEPVEAQEFFAAMDPLVHDLSVTWHSFDLDKIDKDTRRVVALLRAKRDEVRRRRAASR